MQFFTQDSHFTFRALRTICFTLLERCIKGGPSASLSLRYFLRAPEEKTGAPPHGGATTRPGGEDRSPYSVCTEDRCQPSGRFPPRSHGHHQPSRSSQKATTPVCMKCCDEGIVCKCAGLGDRGPSYTSRNSSRCPDLDPGPASHRSGPTISNSLAHSHIFRAKHPAHPLRGEFRPTLVL